MDLSKEARTLLDSARMADCAPRDIQHRARQRFVSAVAAGTIGTSALVSKGATLGAVGASAGTSATLAGASLTATWVSAVVTGLSLGIVAISPTTNDQLAINVSAVRATPSPMANAGNRGATIVSSAPQRSEPQTQEISAPVVSSSEAAQNRALQSPAESARVQVPRDVGAAPIEALRDTEAAPNATTQLDVSVPSQPTKASIARETEMLAEVQRALQQGRPATALTKLNQYDAAFPSGMLREESTASRVMALCAFGRERDAERWATEFFRRYPNSPLSARVRGACRTAGLAGPNGQGTSK
jgi:hypothetical protein